MRSEQAQSERPAASRRASASAARRQGTARKEAAPATETEEGQAITAPHTAPHDVVGTDPALEAAPSEQQAPSPAPSPGGKRSSKSSRRAPVASNRRSTRNATAADEAPRRSSRRANTADPGKKRRDMIIMGSIVGLLLLAGGLALAWPGIRRGMLLNAIDAAGEPAAAVAAADDYLAYVDFNPGHVRSAIGAQRGPIEAQIHLAQAIASPDDLIAIGTRAGLNDDQRAAAIEAAAVLIDDDITSRAYLDDDKLEEWALQRDRSDKHKDLAAAATHLIAARGTDNAAEVFAGVIQDPAAHPDILTAAIAHLPAVLSASNVGYGLALITGPNNDRVIASNALLEAITVNVRPAHIDRIFALLDHADVHVQAIGARFLHGNGMTMVSPAEQESIGERIMPYLQAEVRASKPELFAEALKATATLRLTGAREQLVKLMSEVPADSDDAATIAACLGRGFPRKGAQYEALNEDLLAKLTAALAVPASRATAAAALAQWPIRSMDGLHPALEAAVAQNDAGMDAAIHIVAELFERDDVIVKLGRDADAWQRFLPADRLRMEQFAAMQTFANESRGMRTTAGGPAVKAAKKQCTEYQAVLSQWLSPGSKQVMPLGLSTTMVKKLQGEMGIAMQQIVKATPAL
ncbi:MAG: hypothetical protein PF961_23115 [Planctomycetota bacterium]|nr:hypothetical protein [Planctomycetota bacterium]